MGSLGLGVGSHPGLSNNDNNNNIILMIFKMIIIIMIMVILVVLAIWVCSLRRLHTVWERTLNYTQVLVKTKNLEDLIIII